MLDGMDFQGLPLRRCQGTAQCLFELVTHGRNGFVGGRVLPKAGARCPPAHAR